VALKAEKIKAPKNEGNLVSMPNQVSYDNVPFISNLEHLGLSVGKDEVSTSNALIELTKAIQSGAGEAKNMTNRGMFGKNMTNRGMFGKKLPGNGFEKKVVRHLYGNL
jgi:hypothetical protein